MRSIDEIEHHFGQSEKRARIKKRPPAVVTLFGAISTIFRGYWSTSRTAQAERIGSMLRSEERERKSHERAAMQPAIDKRPAAP